MKLTINTEADRERFISLCGAVKLKPGKSYLAEFKLKVKRRSVPQNSLLWLFYTAIAKQTEYGYTSNEWHEYYRHKFLPRKEVLGNMVPVSTTQLDSREFSEYLNRIYDDSLIEHGVELVWPEEKRFTEFYDTYHGVVS